MRVFGASRPRRVAAAGAVVALATMGAGSASAHIAATPKTAPAGSWTVTTLSVPHGCDGSDTLKVKIEIPEDIVQLSATRNANWDIKTVKEPVNPPVSGAHGKITQRTSEVIYSAKTPLPADQRDTFELAYVTPDTPGATLLFPVTQTCVKGSYEWVAAPGESTDNAKNQPAPTVRVVRGPASDTHGPHAHGPAAPADRDRGRDDDRYKDRYEDRDRDDRYEDRDRDDDRYEDRDRDDRYDDDNQKTASRTAAERAATAGAASAATSDSSDREYGPRERVLAQADNNSGVWTAISILVALLIVGAVAVVIRRKR